MNGLARVSEEGERRKIGLNISNGSKMDNGLNVTNGSKIIPGFHRGSDTRDLLWYHFDTENRSHFFNVCKFAAPRIQVEKNEN